MNTQEVKEYAKNLALLRKMREQDLDDDTAVELQDHLNAGRSRIGTLYRNAKDRLDSILEYGKLALGESDWNDCRREIDDAPPAEPKKRGRPKKNQDSEEQGELFEGEDDEEEPEAEAEPTCEGCGWGVKDCVCEKGQTSALEGMQEYPSVPDDQAPAEHSNESAQSYVPATDRLPRTRENRQDHVLELVGQGLDRIEILSKVTYRWGATRGEVLDDVDDLLKTGRLVGTQLGQWQLPGKPDTTSEDQKSQTGTPEPDGKPEGWSGPPDLREAIMERVREGLSKDDVIAGAAAAAETTKAAADQKFKQLVFEGEIVKKGRGYAAGD